MTKKPIVPQASDCGLSRRDFLKISAATGGVAFLGALPFVQEALANGDGHAVFELARPKKPIYTVCLQCNTGCPIKVKLLDGVAAKIDGNPYAPGTMLPHLDYATPVHDAGTVEGAICPKGQAGLQS